jgi:hypothetical protein
MITTLTTWGKALADATAIGAASVAAAGPAPAPLNDKTFWLGNSFPGRDREKGKWVALDIDDIFVFPDGRVVADCGWDEGGRAIGFYKDGDCAGKVDDPTALTGGIAVTADEQFLFALRTERKLGENDPMWHGVARYTLDGKPSKWAGAEGRVRNVLFLHPPSDKGGKPLTGVAARGGELFLSDPVARAVKVFGTADMAPRREFKPDPATDIPLKMVFDKAGRLWLGQRGEDGKHRLRAYSAKGEYLRVEIADPGEPAGLALDGEGRLLVADNGPRQQVRVYTVSGTAPSLQRAVGIEGGVYAAPAPGRVADDRFCGLIGAGVDGQGALYVSSNGCGPYGDDNGLGAKLQKFDPAGKCLWTLEGLEFVDSACADPGEDTSVFSKDSRYEVDYRAAATGEGWPHAGWRHAAWTVHRFKHPNDPRLHIRQEGARVARLRDGRKLLGCQWDGHLAVYRFEGEIAVPAAVFSRDGSKPGEWPPNNPHANKAWMWADKNGDGAFQADEFEAIADRNIDVMRAWHLDDEGTAWIGEQGGTIHRFPVERAAGAAAPLYALKTRTTVPAPAGITHLRFMRYLAATDTMYLATYSKENPQETWYPMAREIRRYDKWSSDRKPAWTLVLPYRYKDSRGRDTQPISFDAEGDYVFVAFDWGSDETRRLGEIVAYRASDGSKAGGFWPGAEVGGRSGCIDFGSAIHARKRADGTYVVFAEEDEFAKILYYIWKPNGKR